MERGRAEAQRRGSAEARAEARGKPLWSGPPGCTCDLSRPARDRCNRIGWLRCQGALNAMVAQTRYRDDVGRTGGQAKKGKSFLDIFVRAQKPDGGEEEEIQAMKNVQAKIIRKQGSNELAVGIGVVGVNNDNIVTVITFEEAVDLRDQLTAVIDELNNLTDPP